MFLAVVRDLWLKNRKCMVKWTNRKKLEGANSPDTPALYRVGRLHHVTGVCACCEAFWAVTSQNMAILTNKRILKGAIAPNHVSCGEFG